MPESCPVPLSKVAHAGIWAIVNTRRRPCGLVTVGVNEKFCPAVIDVGGTPEIVMALAHGCLPHESSCAALLAFQRRITMSATSECHSGYRWPNCR